jgi:hypothetical protein
MVSLGNLDPRRRQSSWGSRCGCRTVAVLHPPGLGAETSAAVARLKRTCKLVSDPPHPGSTPAQDDSPRRITPPGPTVNQLTTRDTSLPGTGRSAALVVGASISTTPRVEGSGRTVLACPTTSRNRSHQPSRHPSRAHSAALSSRADFVGSAACPWWSLGMPRRPPSPGSKGRADRPARQPEEGSSVPEATVSFAGNLTADPEVRYTESGLQGDDEIGRTSLYDAEGKMRHPSALDHPRALQVDRPGA